MVNFQNYPLQQEYFIRWVGYLMTVNRKLWLKLGLKEGIFCTEMEKV